VLPRTDQAIRAAVGKRVNGEQSAKTPVTAVQPVPPEWRTQTVLDIQGCQEERWPAQHVERHDFRTAGEVVPQHDVPHLNRPLEGTVSVVPNVPPRPRLEMLAARADRGEIRHAADRGTDPQTIQVSIGRIEVRATVASAPAKKVQTKSSAMSLDEYLTRRNEGRR